MPKPKKEKLLKGKKLTKVLDQAVRDYFKLLYGNNPTCFVCGQQHGWFHPTKSPKGCQVGHYVSRQYFTLRWDLLNLFPQCSGCNWEHSNRNFGSNPTPFTLAILKKIGEERIQYLSLKSNRFDRERVTDLQKREILQELLSMIDKLSV
jgi:hypothetical protein